MAVYWIFTGPQNAKFKGSKYVSTKNPQYKRERENLGVYGSIHMAINVRFHWLEEGTGKGITHTVPQAATAAAECCTSQTERTCSL